MKADKESFIEELHDQLIEAAGREEVDRDRSRLPTFIAAGGALAALVLVISFARSDREPLAPRDHGGTVTPTEPVPPAAAIAAWDRIGPEGALVAEFYETVHGLASVSDQVIVATVAYSEPGRIVNQEDSAQGGAARYLNLTLHVEQTLRGGARPGDEVTVTVGPFELGRDLGEAAAPLLGDQGVFFLRLNGSAIEGIRDADPAEMRLGEYHVVTGAGLLLNDADRATFPWLDEALRQRTDMAEWSGDRFQAVVESIAAQVRG